MIPTRIKVGRTWYEVKHKKLPFGVRGVWHYKHSSKQYTDIRISADSFTQDEKEETFWHELTHAILHHIGRRKLNDDEEFVTDFAKMLHKAIKSARFE